MERAGSLADRAGDVLLVDLAAHGDGAGRSHGTEIGREMHPARELGRGGEVDAAEIAPDLCLEVGRAGFGAGDVDAAVSRAGRDVRCGDLLRRIAPNDVARPRVGASTFASSTLPLLELSLTVLPFRSLQLMAPKDDEASHSPTEPRVSEILPLSDLR